MIPIKDLIDKIKWDDRENPDEYTLEYLDFNVLKSIKYTDIKEIEGSFMIVEVDIRDTYIPLHRIKIVKKNGKVIWKRPIIKK
jgi:uncharacterized protein (UPF0248 family)